MAAPPLSALVLSAGSVADDLSYVALTDLAGVLADSDRYRIIGGHMVTALVTRWALGASLYRETGDTDLGAPPIVLKDLDIVGRLQALGYEHLAGYRFGRPVSDVPGLAEGADVPKAIVDILTPAYTSQARKNWKVTDDLVTIEVPGLATALQRDPVRLDLELVRLSGEAVSIRLAYPDELSAVLLKAFVTTARSKDTDVVDIWRCLEVASAAGLGPVDFDNEDGVKAAAIVHALFRDSGSPGETALASAQNLSEEALAARVTRIRALAERVLGPDQGG